MFIAEHNNKNREKSNKPLVLVVRSLSPPSISKTHTQRFVLFFINQIRDYFWIRRCFFFCHVEKS